MTEPDGGFADWFEMGCDETAGTQKAAGRDSGKNLAYKKSDLEVDGEFAGVGNKDEGEADSNSEDEWVLAEPAPGWS